MKKLLALMLGMMMVASQPAVASQSAGASQQPAAPFAFSAQYFLGKWTDTNDCSVAVVFHADGSFTTPTGNKGKWSLNGNQLTLSGASATTFTVLPESHTKLWLYFQDGRVGSSTRC